MKNEMYIRVPRGVRELEFGIDKDYDEVANFHINFIDSKLNSLKIVEIVFNNQITDRKVILDWNTSKEKRQIGDDTETFEFDVEEIGIVTIGVYMDKYIYTIHVDY